jgi:hypothetical protein
MKCPKCGHEQPDGGLDCGRCGIVFSRYRPPTPAAGAAPVVAGLPGPPESSAAAAPPAQLGGWEPAVVGSAVARNPAGTEPARGPARPAGEQLYAGPVVEGAGAHKGGTGEIEERHELTGRLYEGPLPSGEAAAVGMALRPAARERTPAPGALPPPGRSAWPAGGAAALRFTYAGVMRDTFSIFAANVVPFLLIAAVAVVPLAVAGLLAAATGGRLALLAFAFVGLIELVLAGPLVTGAITFGVAQELRHREASIGDCLRLALSSVLAILGVALLQSLVVLGGLFLCIVPGIVAGVVLCVSVPAALEERNGVVAALHRSADLTRGHRWEVAGVLLSFAALQYVLPRLASLAVPGGGITIGHQLPSTVAGLIGTALQATADAVMYYRLRSAAEGVGIAALPSIFD